MDEKYYDYDLNIWEDEEAKEVSVTMFPVINGDTMIDRPITTIPLTKLEVEQLNQDQEIYDGFDSWASLENVPDWLKDKLWQSM